MGLLARLRGLFGGGEEQREPDPDDLLELPGLALTVEAAVGFEVTGEAALCFAAADAGGFEDTIADLEGVLEATEAESGTAAAFREDGHGWRWLVLTDEDPEDLASGLEFAASTFVDDQYGDQLLAAVIAFDVGDAAGVDAPHAYLVYSFERGRFYPFVPTGTEDRDTATEFRLQSVLREEVPFEEDRSQWFPLWPDRAGEHPWE